MNNFKYKRKSLEGFTLIELMVAISIFTIVMTVAVGSLFTIISANKRARALQLTMDNLHFAIDEMTRDIRTGTDYQYSGAGAGTGCEDPFVFSFVASDGANIDYRCVNGRLQKRSNSAGWFNVTAGEINITRFYLDDRSTLQPRALLLIGGKAKADRDVETEFNLQTTVSQRKLNLQ